MHKLIRDTISVANTDKLATINTAVCYEWEIIPVNKALSLTYKWLINRIENC